MSDELTGTGGNRLPAHARQVINRNRKLAFQFDGKRVEAYEGDTIASALAAAGINIISRSFKYHRPRGLLCCSGHCPNCLVQVGPDMNIRACTRQVSDGMKVEPQNAWPSLDFDLMSFTELAGRFLPVGFYYKTFLRPQSLWPTYEHLLRNAAGLGAVREEIADQNYEKRYVHADVVVVGGGPAGLSAALAAGQQGARVALFDENAEVGGHERFTGTVMSPTASKLIIELARLPNVEIVTDTTVLGWWEQNWLAAMSATCLYKIRAQSVVFATGAYEQPLLFGNNDLPGIMLGSAAQRLMQLHGVSPGKQAVVCTANNDGWDVAAQLHAAGVTIAAIVEERTPDAAPDEILSTLNESSVPIYWEHTVKQAKGYGILSGVVVQPLAGGRGNTISCDLLTVSIGWAPANGLLYQAGARAIYDHDRGEFLPPVDMPDGIFCAGRVAGSHELGIEIAEGRHAGLQAAAHVGLGDPPDEAETAVLRQSKAEQPVRTSTRIETESKKKQFLCFCEDVTHKDLKVSVAEGYNSIELLKRYSTISMGPCQGKMCSANTIHLCARANGWSIEETGSTTARPPMQPVPLSILAGQNMEPVQKSPVHEWHERQGARMMVAGLWLRPEHYGDATEEVKAVRERVGLIDVSTLGKLRLTGPGVPDLLDRIYINKWQQLGVDRVRYGIMCNDEGVILDDGVTAHFDEYEYYTTTTSSGASAMYEWLQWWAQSGWGEGVHITNVSDNYAAFNLAGPHARNVLEPLTFADVGNEAFPYMHVRSFPIAGIPCRIMRIGFTGELSYEIHCPSAYGPALWQALMDGGQGFDIRPFGVEAQRILRLEKGHIIVGQDTDALTDPMMAEMGWAVKLDKADFLGKRAISRVTEVGVKQKLVGFEMVTPRVVPHEGLQIVRQGAFHQVNIIGWVTSSRYSPTLNKAIGLCWLPPEMAEENGARFNIRMNKDLLVAKVHHGAFYDPQGQRLRS